MDGGVLVARRFFSLRGPLAHSYSSRATLAAQSASSLVHIISSLVRGPGSTNAYVARSASSFAQPGQLTQTPLQAVFTCGVPAAGKTHVLDRVFGWWRDRLVIDLDTVIKSHPDFNPHQPHEIYESREAYEWADARVAERFAQALAERVPRRLIVYDGTGTKVATRVERMELARASGYTVTLLYVRVQIETALERNARRTRRVPDEILRRYYDRIERTFELEVPHADVVHVVENDGESLADDFRICLPHSKLEERESECLTPLRSIPRVVMEETLPEPHTGGLAQVQANKQPALRRSRDSSGCIIVPDSVSQ